MAALIFAGAWLPFMTAQAQDTETEPNDPCARAQNLGAIPLPHAVLGSLDSTETKPDVDFFRIVGAPGTLLQVNLRGASFGNGSLSDPYLGAFSSGCNLIAVNDDSTSVDSQLVVQIPSDGFLILGATQCCDGEFVGGGVGTYRLDIAAFAAIRSITGRVADAVTGRPPDFSDVRLLRCDESGCSDVSGLGVGGDGRFQFSVDFSGQPLPAGTYQIVASASEYETTQTDPFEVGEGEERQVGDVLLQPLPIRFSDPVPCAEIPANGGTCRYSVRITNRLGTKLKGAVWSIVTGSGIGTLTDRTVFQTHKPQKISLRSQEGKVVQFDFEVPADVRAGAFICAEAYFGDDRQEPQFNTVGQAFLFCINKTGGMSFSVVPDKKAQKMMRSSEIRSTAQPKGKVR